MSEMLHAQNVAKSFTLHTQGSVTIPVFEGIEFMLSAGDCIALTGESGSGKSTFMRILYANYTCSQGSIKVFHDGDWLDITTASPHSILEIRKRTLGYVSQFLRVIPRVPTLDIVAEPLVALGTDRETATEKARDLLTRLRIPERLWQLSPLTFSGGEQQRVNIARGFIADYPIMLLDEPTASLDVQNRATVLALIEEAKSRGAAIAGIFHDHETRDAVCTGSFDVTSFKVGAND
ncbi:MAG TPA: phosphonate C-P lyase system protein PhnL [Thalassospira sp.]|nr:phosphonate C-P lyase system protein PhnL [Thalassospira sp.]|tara:strand:+ start:1688 stop:2392 length:705 start_codon:yes stop_codon:yes gene_type:complete